MTYSSLAEYEKSVKKAIEASGRVAVRAKYDYDGNCLECGEAGRCPGWHAGRLKFTRIPKGTRVTTKDGKSAVLAQNVRRYGDHFYKPSFVYVDYDEQVLKMPGWSEGMFEITSTLTFPEARSA